MRIIKDNSINNLAHNQKLMYNMRIIKDKRILYGAYSEENMVLRRKIYNTLLDWKKNSKRTKAILIEGARRIGKSTVCEEFAKNEYKSYILIDFSKKNKEIEAYFEKSSKRLGYLHTVSQHFLQKI